MRHLSLKQFENVLLPKVNELRTPELVIFELTYGCNLKCVHCSNPTHKSLPHELTTQEVCAILEQLADLGVLTLCFTGGELFVRPDVFAILERAKRLGFLLELISNATRITPAVADRIHHLQFQRLCFSIYGATAAVYEHVTGIPGSFNQFLRGLECAASTQLPVSAVRMPMMTVNAHEVHAAKALVERYGFKFQYCAEIFPRTDGDLTPLAFRLSPVDKVRLLETLGDDHTSQSAEDLCPSTDRFIECACGRNRFAITPYGEMNLCTGFPIPRYDLRRGTVAEGWKILKSTVDAARPNHHYECHSCEFRRCCNQKRNHAWLETGDMSACIPHFKEWAKLEHRTHALLDPRQSR
jgi:radical SAM protein with 4Fe4S-binding SPASM domain